MRKANSLKNFVTSIFPFIILIFIGFWKVNVWQNTLDENVYALNQLFFQIFSYLSLAEAGIGALVQKEYYKLLASDDRDDICIFYTLSKSMLRKVCYIIFALGIGCSFFLPSLSNGNTLSLGYMQRIFILFLLKSLVEYFMFSPRFVLQADQKLYKINIQMNLYKIVEGIMEVLLILYGFSFESVLIVSFFLRIVMNAHVNRIIFKEYPWLRVVTDLKGKKIRGMSHVFIYKVVSVIYENVDLMLISAYINPLAVIIYSNYKYITKYLSDIIYMVGTSLTSSLGNLIYLEKKERSYDTYEMINTMFYFIGCFLTIALGHCINAFICIWVGADKLFDTLPLYCLLFTLFHTVVRRPQYMLKDIFAFYKELQLISIAEALLNVVLSFWLVQRYGVSGVLVATVISTSLTNFWYFPLFLYRQVFDKKPWLDLIKYVFSVGLSLFLLWGSETFLPAISSSGYIAWFVSSALYAIGLLIVLMLIFYALFKSFRRLMASCLAMVPGMKKWIKEKG